MNQCKRVLGHLQQGRTITRKQGMDMGIANLPARICELRAQGHRIETMRFQMRNRYGELITMGKWYMEEPF